MAFLFGSPVVAQIVLDGAEERKTVEVTTDNGTDKVLLYIGNEAVKGVAKVNCKEGKKYEHQGIKIEFIGLVEMFYERGSNHEFVFKSQELASAGEITGSNEFRFEFADVEKQYESYNGINVRLRYFLRLTVTRGLASTVTTEKDIWVHNYHQSPEVNNPIKMEVGIEDCLHIEFEYNRSKYHLKDVIIGKIYFLLVRIKIKHMEIAIIKRESTGSGPNLYNESDTITKYEIMDGAPVRGESIPIRLFLTPFELTPTYRNIHNKFSLKYYLNLVLVDEEDRRYFKQQEIVLWRKADKTRAKVGERTRQHRRYEGKRDREAAEREKAGIKEEKDEGEEHEY